MDGRDREGRKKRGEGARKVGMNEGRKRGIIGMGGGREWKGEENGRGRNEGKAGRGWRG